MFVTGKAYVKKLAGCKKGFLIEKLALYICKVY